MRTLLTSIVACSFGVLLGGCSHRQLSTSAIVGLYAADDGKSTVHFQPDGTYALEDRSGEVAIWLAPLPEERWERKGDRLTLSWGDASQEQRPIRKIVYAIVATGDDIELQLIDGQRIPSSLSERPMGVPICERYRKTSPNKAREATATAGMSAAGQPPRQP